MPYGGGFKRGFRKPFGPVVKTKIKCSECGKEDEVPFKPREGTPVYCKACFFKKKGITPREKKEESQEEAESEQGSEEESEDESEEQGED
jgi:CxxC-x17-CxxC domain-containing protein